LQAKWKTIMNLEKVDAEEELVEDESHPQPFLLPSPSRKNVRKRRRSSPSDAGIENVKIERKI
jgi:hypothetical protein